MPITALYASLLTLLYLYLSYRVISVRRAAKVEIGTMTREGEDRALLRRVRVHANFAEYTPIALILLGLLESLKAPALELHAIGSTFLVARIVHAYGLSQTPHNVTARVLGMVVTLCVLAVAAVGCLYMTAAQPDRGSLLGL